MKLQISMKRYIAIWFMIFSHNALAVDVVFDPSNLAKNTLIAANSLSGLTNQAQQIANQLRAIDYQTKNSSGISDYQWRDITNLIAQMDATTKQGQSLSYSMGNLDNQFKTTYPDYSKQNLTNYSAAYQSWSTNTLSTLSNTLQAVGQSATNFNNEQQLLTQLKNQGSSATGRMQALQISTALATENINQLQSLKRLISAQTNAQNSYMAHQVSKESYSDESLNQVLSNLNSVKSTSHQSFGLIPKMP